jgi:hypothetical protein
MTPSKQAKQAGLKSLAELSRISHVPVTTLRDWHKLKPELFSFICKAGIIISSDIKGE